jgi:hypothetical protein
MVAHFNAEEQTEARELDSNILEKGATQHWPMYESIKSLK